MGQMLFQNLSHDSCFTLINTEDRLERIHNEGASDHNCPNTQTSTSHVEHK